MFVAARPLAAARYRARRQPCSPSLACSPIGRRAPAGYMSSMDGLKSSGIAASSLRRGYPLRPVGYPAQRRMEPWFAFAWSLAQWAVRTARQAAPALAQLPPTCRDALAHTALVCAGATPAYYPPGWGPWCLSWGWFCLGVMSGAAATAFLVWRAMPIRPHAAATASSPPPWHVAATHVLSCAAGGPAELKALATQAGTSPEDLLCNLFREATAAGATRSPPRGLPPHASPTLATPGPQPQLQPQPQPLRRQPLHEPPAWISRSRAWSRRRRQRRPCSTPRWPQTARGQGRKGRQRRTQRRTRTWFQQRWRQGHGQRWRPRRRARGSGRLGGRRSGSCRALRLTQTFTKNF